MLEKSKKKKWAARWHLNKLLKNRRQFSFTTGSSCVLHWSLCLWIALLRHITDQHVSLYVFCTCVSLECGDQAAAVLLQLQDGHLTGLVPNEGVSGLHIKSGIRLRSKKKKRCPADRWIHLHPNKQTCGWVNYTVITLSQSIWCGSKGIAVDDTLRLISFPRVLLWPG